jgi:zinc transport system substrate-binding protein
VFHDAYRYFEEHYGLHSAGAITANPEISPGAKRIINIRERIATERVRCVFREPQFPSALVHTIVEDTGAHLGTLDPEGANIPPGPNAYFILMQRLAASLVGCLARRDGG